MTSPRCVCWLRFSCLVTPFYSPCEKVWEIRRGWVKGRETRVFSPSSSLLSPAWNLVSTSEDAVIRRRERERENGMIKRIRLSREEEHGQSRAFGREVEELLCFSFFPLFLLFFSQDRHTSSSSSSLAWHWKGCNTGRTPGGSRRFSMKQRSNETALGFLGMCRCNRENGGDASIIRNGRNCDTFYSIRGRGRGIKVSHGGFFNTRFNERDTSIPQLVVWIFQRDTRILFLPSLIPLIS